MRTSRGMSPLGAVLIAAAVGLVLGSVLILAPSSPPPGATGTVEGVVSVGPSQPVCRVGEPCTVNMTGYSLVFTKQCSSLCPALSRAAPLAGDGSYSIALPAGTYSVTLSSCPWLRCSSAVPRTVSVDSGQTTFLNITIDTGIR